MKSIVRVTILCAVALVLVACGATPPPTSRPAPTNPYPASTGLAATAYPAPASCNVPALKMDRASLVPGSTAVTGTGPANVPIRIDSVFDMGKTLGTGTIGADGKFSIPVTTLVNNDYVGLRLNDAGFAQTNLDENTYLNNTCYFAPDAGQVPQVGFYFDRATVKAP